MGSGGGIARTSFSCTGQRRLGQTKKTVMRTAFYVRVSPERQQQAQTIEQQVALLRSYVADRPEWVVEEQHVFRDDGHTGAIFEGLERHGISVVFIDRRSKATTVVPIIQIW